MNDGKLNGWILQGFNVFKLITEQKTKTVAGYEQIEILNRNGSTSN